MPQESASSADRCLQQISSELQKEKVKDDALSPLLNEYMYMPCEKQKNTKDKSKSSTFGSSWARSTSTSLTTTQELVQAIFGCGGYISYNVRHFY